MSDYTAGPLNIKRSPTPDNVGGHDYAVYDAENCIIAETYEIVDRGPNGFVRRPAEANARLFAAAANLVTALRELCVQVERSNAVDDNGHALAHLKALADARALLSRIDGAA